MDSFTDGVILSLYYLLLYCLNNIQYKEYLTWFLVTSSYILLLITPSTNHSLVFCHVIKRTGIVWPTENLLNFTGISLSS